MKDFLRALVHLSLAGRLLGFNSASHSVLDCMLQTHAFENVWGVILRWGGLVGGLSMPDPLLPVRGVQGIVATMVFWGMLK